MARFDKARWQVVSPLLDELLDTSGAQRDARLARIQSQDRVLADELAALLAINAEVETGQFLEGSALARIGELTLAGKRIGGYTLQRQLGAGGMGTVWLARRSDGLFEGQAAVKFLNLGLLGHGGAERFRREGTALAKLAHPNIAHLIDAGATDGQPYLIIEFVKGEPLDAWCDARTLDVGARIRLFQQVLAAVAYAHGKLVLHRDLKPSNILVTPDGRVKLLDFGVAKLLDEKPGRSVRTELTQISGRVLTPDYAAPEQVQGTEVSTATDVHTLGVLLFRLLAGAHPTAQPFLTPVERLRAIAEDEPQRLSDAAHGASSAIASARNTTPDALARSLRGDLDNIVAKALKKAPAERYSTVDAFAADLQRFLNDEPVTARPDSHVYRATKFVRRHRVSVAALVTVLLTLVGGMAATAWHATEARRQRTEAMAQAARAEASRRFVDMMVSELGDEKTLTPLQLLDRGMVLLEQQGARDPEFFASELLHMAVRYTEVEQFGRARALLDRAQAAAVDLGDNALGARAGCEAADTDLLLGDRAAAQRRLDEASALLARADHPSLKARAACLNARASVLDAAGEKRKAITQLEEAIGLLQAEGAGDDPAYPAMLTRLSKYHSDLGEPALAYEYTRRAGEVLERTGYGGTIDRLVTLNNEAIDLVSFGEIAAATSLFADLVRRMDARGPSTRISFHANYGLALALVGRTDEAIRTLQDALMRARDTHNAVWETQVRYYLARAFIVAGRFDEAAAALDSVEQVYRRDPAMNRSFLRGIALARSDLLLREGRGAESRQVADALLAEIGYPDKPVQVPGVAPILRQAAEAALSTGDRVRAGSLAAASLDAAQKSARGADRSADVGRAHLILGQVRFALGDIASGRTELVAAIPGLRNGLGAGHAATLEAQRLLQDSLARH
ncbi:MAG TPA: serine/threonine-protein kinase [Burkholderiaceae bacterium]|nr:serine/threonine-protein kinase [Burkholderiaceae bacterium]